MSGGSEFSAQVPKGDAWGVEHAIANAVSEFEATGRSPIIACIALIGIKGVKLTPGDDGPTRTPIVYIRRIEALTTDEAIRNGQKLVMKAMEDRRGKGTMLPFDEAEIIRQAFGGVDLETVEREEQDARELAEDEAMDDPQRLRRHLVNVHKHPAEEVEELEYIDVRTLHDSDHKADPADGMPPHDADWWEWRRVAIEAAEADADGEAAEDDATGPDGLTPEQMADISEAEEAAGMTSDGEDIDGATPAVPGVEFRAGDESETED